MRASRSARLGAFHREAVHDHTVVVGGRAGRVLVAPGVVVARAGREHLDVPPASREAVRGLAHHGFGAADDLGAVPGGDEREPARFRGHLGTAQAVSFINVVSVSSTCGPGARDGEVLDALAARGHEHPAQRLVRA